MKTRDDIFEMGHEALAIGDLITAENHYGKTVEIDPTFAEGWHALGMVLYKQAKYPEAILAGMKASQLNPQDQMTWTSLSLAYMKNKQIPEAEAAAAKAKIIGWGGKIRTDF